MGGSPFDFRLFCSFMTEQELCESIILIIDLFLINKESDTNGHRLKVPSAVTTHIYYIAGFSNPRAACGSRGNFERSAKSHTALLLRSSEIRISLFYDSLV